MQSDPANNSSRKNRVAAENGTLPIVLGSVHPGVFEEYLPDRPKDDPTFVWWFVALLAIFFVLLFGIFWEHYQNACKSEPSSSSKAQLYAGWLTEDCAKFWLYGIHHRFSWR